MHEYPQPQSLLDAFTDAEYAALSVAPIPAVGFDALLARHNVTANELPGFIAQKAVSLPRLVPDPESIRFIDTLYNLRALANEGGRLAEWATAFRSQEAFFQVFAPNATLAERAAFCESMWLFVTAYQHPARLVSLRENNAYWYADSPTKKEFHFYEAEDIWMGVPPAEHGFDRKIISRDVAEEVTQLIREGWDVDQELWYHTTSSGAVDGIVRDRALLSAASMQQWGKRPKTGAFVREAVNPKDVGLNGVYAAQSIGMNSYEALGWFDECPVAFGIDRYAVDAFIEQTGVSTTRWNYGPDPETGSGRILGPIVPLDCVEVAFCWKRDLPKLRAQLCEAAPHIRVQSLEAAKVLDEEGVVLRRSPLPNHVQWLPPPSLLNFDCGP